MAVAKRSGDMAELVTIELTDPLHSDAQFCLQQFYAELDRRFDGGYDPADSIPAEPDDMRPPAGVFLVATLRGEPIGCGALKFHADQPTELKRMWVSRNARGLGVGRRLLTELERLAAHSTSRVIHLETNATLIEAIAMYRAAGYREVAPFSDDPYATHWFEKSTSPETSASQAKAWAT
jgi:GNAT superfamily N-acetyltransferase